MADRPTSRLDGPSQPSGRPKRGKSGATKHSAGPTVRFAVLAARGCETTGVGVGVRPPRPSATGASERLLTAFLPPDRFSASGSGRAYRVGGATIRCCGRAKSRSAMSGGWSASTSRSLGATCNGCGIRCREADPMARTPGLGRRRYGWGSSRACVPRDDRVRRTCKSVRPPFPRGAD